jgi:CheY-like chemotaxis protein
MGPVVETCLHCGKPITRAARGRPQKFCTDAHRQAYRRLNGHQRPKKSNSALLHTGGQNRQISLCQPIDLIAESQPEIPISDFRMPVIDLVGTDLLSDVVATETARLKPVPASAYKHLKLERVNAGTWKVVNPDIKTDVPAKLGFWAGTEPLKP